MQEYWLLHNRRCALLEDSLQPSYFYREISTHHDTWPQSGSETCSRHAEAVVHLSPGGNSVR